MCISPEEFCTLFPRLYHMAHEDAWKGIRSHGLLSTSALLDLFEVNDERRRVIESRHRPESIVIEHPVYGRAVIRDQKPMSENALRKCLQGMSPTQWFETLNGKVFFWLNEERLGRLLAARAYREDTHCILTINTRPLIDRHLARVSLSPINSGSTIFNPQPRGSATFLPLRKYPFSEWARKRSTRNAVVELAVDYHVPDISELVLRVVQSRAGATPNVLYAS